MTYTEYQSSGPGPSDYREVLVFNSESIRGEPTSKKISNPSVRGEHS